VTLIGRDAPVGPSTVIVVVSMQWLTLISHRSVTWPQFLARCDVVRDVCEALSEVAGWVERVCDPVGSERC
jgi:hypothetical protein